MSEAQIEPWSWKTASGDMVSRLELGAREPGEKYTA